MIKEKEMYEEALNQVINHGIKFTVDDLCKKIKISKKTFYKMFPSKGDFAKWIYENAFKDFDKNLKNCNKSSKQNKLEIENLFTSYCVLLSITKEHTFNLYSLNEQIKDFALKNKAIKQKEFFNFLKTSKINKYMENEMFLYTIKASLNEITLTKNTLFLKKYISFIEGL
ncbi:MAG: TetR/AcrR family transcriptional regulator [Bacilli bacterium]